MTHICLDAAGPEHSMAPRKEEAEESEVVVAGAFQRACSGTEERNMDVVRPC